MSCSELLISERYNAHAHTRVDVLMTFLSPSSSVKKISKNPFFLGEKGIRRTLRARSKMMRERRGGRIVLFPYHPKKSGRSKAPPRLFVLQEIKYEAIKLPVNREPRRRRRRQPLLFFCASNLGASRKGQIMASL